jgi:nucleolar protein 14
MSKRLIPEAIAFVGSSILALLPRRKDSELPKLYPALRAPTTDLASASLPASREPVDLPSLMTGESDSEQSKADVLAVALRLVSTYSTLYSSFDAFIEIFAPISRVLETSRVAKLAPELKVSCDLDKLTFRHSTALQRAP